MNYATSRHPRTLLGRLSRGENLVASIQRVCQKERVRAGTIRAVGVLQKITLQAYVPGKGYRTVLDEEGSFELVLLNGNVSTLGDQIVLNCYAQVGAHNHGQWQSFGGRLLEATALSVEFAIDVCDDLLLERRLEPKTGLPILNRVETLSGESMVDRSDSPIDNLPADAPAPDPTPQPAPKAEEPPAAKAPASSGSTAAIKEPTPAPKAKPSQPRRRATSATSEAAGTTTANTAAPEVVRRPSWGDAIEYSSKSRKKSKLGIEEDKSSKNLDKVVDWPDAPDIRPGDLLEHPHFGLCKVIYVEEDNFVRVRKRNRKVVDIKLEVCDMEPSGNKDGKRLFTCSIVSR